MAFNGNGVPAVEEDQGFFGSIFDTIKTEAQSGIKEGVKTVTSARLEKLRTDIKDEAERLGKRVINKRDDETSDTGRQLEAQELPVNQVATPEIRIIQPPRQPNAKEFEIIEKPILSGFKIDPNILIGGAVLLSIALFMKARR